MAEPDLLSGGDNRSAMEDDSSDVDDAAGPAGWPEVVVERVASAAQALQLTGYAALALDDLLLLLRRSRALLRERDDHLSEDQAAVLEAAPLLAQAVQASLATADRILKLDPQAHTWASKPLKLVLEFSLYLVSLLQCLCDTELLGAPAPNVAQQAALQGLMTIQAMLWPSADLQEHFLGPRAVETCLRDIGGAARVALMAQTLPPLPGPAQPPQAHVFNELAQHSLPALVTDVWARAGGLAAMASVVRCVPPTNSNSLVVYLQLLLVLGEMDADTLGMAAAGEPQPHTEAHAQALMQAVCDAANLLLAQIQADPERLAERERAFLLLSRTFDTLFIALATLGRSTPAARIAADAQVRELQRAFVLRMLRSTNFNNLLSGARECQRMLTRAAMELQPVDGGASLQDSGRWLDDHAVIQTLLKANLHQRQYADLVLGILQVLTRYGLIRTEHLDMLWGVTEAEGTFDVVKANVYAMIQDLAAHLDPALLEQLFTKFEVLVAGRSLADSVRLLDLLKQLATSQTARPQSADATNVTAERLLALIWKLAVPSDTPLELLACDAMADVLRQYSAAGHRLYCQQYLDRCCRELGGRANVLPALRTLRRLLALYELMGQGDEQEPNAVTSMAEASSSGSALVSVLAQLDDEFRLQALLVGSTLTLMAAARAAGVAARAGLLPDAADGALLGLRVPDFGSHPYAVLLSEHMQTITYVASKQDSYYDQAWAEQLFDALVLEPVLPTDCELGLRFLQDGASPQCAEFLSLGTKHALLARLTALAPAPLSPLAWQVFQQYFWKVNSESKAMHVAPSAELGMAADAARGLMQVQIDSLDALCGLAFVWQAALLADHPDVAHQAADLLIQMYIKGSRDTHLEADAVSQFTRQCVWALCAAADQSGLDATETLPAVAATAGAPPPPAMLPDPCAVRYLQRVLALLCQAAEVGKLPTLPLAPAHQSSYAGIPFELEAQLPSLPGGGSARRIKLPACLQDYVGCLRRALGCELKCPPQTLRLVQGGVEWKNDAHLLRQVLLRPDTRTVVSVAISPVPNAYTQPAPKYAQRWRSTVLALLADQPELHELLLRLADQPQWVSLSGQAAALLQLLPTEGGVRAKLAAALKQAPNLAHASLRALLLGAGARPTATVVTSDAPPPTPTTSPLPSDTGPVRLTYWLQALHALVFPSTAVHDCAQVVGAATGGGGDPASVAGPGPGSPQPGDRALLRSLACCLGVLVDVAAAAAAAAAAVVGPTGGAVQGSGPRLHALHQLMDLHAQLVALLSNLGKRDSLAVLEGCRVGKGIVRPVHLEVMLCSPTESPSVGFMLTPNPLGTPTSALQALTVAGAEAEAETCGAAGGPVAGADAPQPRRLAPIDGATDVAMAGEEGDDVQRRSSGGGSGAGSSDTEGTATITRRHGSGALAPPPAAAPGRPPSTPPSTETPAALLVGLLVRACWQARQLMTGAQGSPDAAPVVRDALAALCKLLHASPDLISAFIAHPISELLVKDVLLAAHSEAVRGAALRALRELCLPSTSAPEPPLAYSWLLGQLVCCRATALACSAANREFFQLLLEVVTKIPQVPDICGGGAASPSPRALAQQLLQAEVQALHDSLPPLALSSATPGGEPSAATTATLRPGWARRGAAEDVSRAAHLASPLGQQELQSRLGLIAGLMRVLGRSSDGGQEQASLIRLLLTRLLFPEAALHCAMQQQDGGALDAQGAAMQGALAFCATSAQARAAAFDLLADILPAGATNMAAGMDTIRALHCSPGTLPRLFERKGEGVEALRPPDGYCGLRNGGATCYMNATLQQLFMQPHVRARLLAGVPVPPDERPDSLYAQLQKLVANLTLSCSGSLRPDEFWQAVKDYDGQPVDVREHQDASEFFTRLQDSIDSHMKATGQEPALGSVFGGVFAHLIMSREGPHRSEREEPFDQVSVDVKGKKTLQESLASYVQGELMEGANAWHCEELGRKVSALRRAAFKALPTTLIVHLKRFEYDHIANQRYKVRERFEFPMVLDMFPYTVEGLAEAEACGAGSPRGAAPAHAVQPQPTSPSAMDTSGVPTSPRGGGNGGDRKGNGKDPRKSCAGDSPMLPNVGGNGHTAGREHPPAPGTDEYRRRYMYELRGVVVHSGSAFAGHYYSFIRERPRVWRCADGGGREASPGRWFSFDDRFVRPWDVSELEEQCFGGAPPPPAADASGVAAGPPPDRAYSAFMLFYDRMDGTCVETEPLPRYLPDCCYPGPPEAVSPALAPSPSGPGARIVVVQKESLATVSGAGGGSGGGQVSTPYGMDPDLHLHILFANLQLVRRVRAFDKDYLTFVRKVCELRLEAAGAGNRKLRRTRRHEAAGQDETGTAQGGPPTPDMLLSPHTSTADPTTAGSGASPSSAGAGTAAVAAHDAATQRDALRVVATQDVAALGLQFVFSVVMQAPVAIMHSELDAWLGLLQRLMQTGPGVVRRVAEVLLELPAGPRTAEPAATAVLLGLGTHKSGAATQFLATLLDAMQPALVAYSNQGLERALADAPVAGGEDDGNALLAAIEANEPVHTHLRLLAELAVKPLMTQMQALAAAAAAVRAGGRRGGRSLAAAAAILDAPLAGYAPCLRLLAGAIALDAPALNLMVGNEWATLPIHALLEITRVVGDPRHEWGHDQGLELAAAAAGVTQVLLRLDDPGQFFLPPRRPRAGQPVQDVAPALPARELSVLAAQAAGLPERLPSDPGPILALALAVQVSRDLLRALRADAPPGESALLAALFTPSALAEGGVPHLIQLLQWDNGVATFWCMARLVRYLNLADLDGPDADAEYLIGLANAAPVLLATDDRLAEARLATLMALPPGDPALPGIALPGVGQLMASGEDAQAAAAWFTLAQVLDPGQLETAVVGWIMPRGARRGQSVHEVAAQVLLQAELADGLGGLYHAIDAWRDHGDPAVRHAKRRALELLSLVARARQRVETALAAHHALAANERAGVRLRMGSDSSGAAAPAAAAGGSDVPAGAADARRGGGNDAAAAAAALGRSGSGMQHPPGTVKGGGSSSSAPGPDEAAVNEEDAVVVADQGREGQ